MEMVCSENHFIWYLFLPDVTKGPKGLVYFFEYKNGEVSMMCENAAMLKYPQLVLQYLENAIA